MAAYNHFTALQQDILSPLVGKIVIGFRYEQSPNPHLFSDRFILRLRPIDKHDSEVHLGIHFKTLGSQIALNLGVTLVVAEGQEMPEGMHGFAREHLQTLAPLLRQPVSQFRLLRDQRLLVALSHQELVFDVDNEDQEGLFLGWAVN